MQVHVSVILEYFHVIVLYKQNAEGWGIGSVCLVFAVQAWGLYLDSQPPREKVGVVVVFICNPSTGEAEIGRFLEFSG